MATIGKAEKLLGAVETSSQITVIDDDESVREGIAGLMN